MKELMLAMMMIIILVVLLVGSVVITYNYLDKKYNLPTEFMWVLLLFYIFITCFITYLIL